MAVSRIEGKDIGICIPVSILNSHKSDTTFFVYKILFLFTLDFFAIH